MSAARRVAGKVSLKTGLDRHAALHAQTYGEAVDAEKPIPPMLEAFMAGIGDSEKEALAKQRRRKRTDQEIAPMRSSTQSMKARSLALARRLGWKATCNGMGSSCHSGNNRINVPSAVQRWAM